MGGAHESHTLTPSPSPLLRRALQGPSLSLRPGPECRSSSKVPTRGLAGQATLHYPGQFNRRKAFTLSHLLPEGHQEHPRGACFPQFCQHDPLELRRATRNDTGQSPGSSLSPIPCECDCTSVSSAVRLGASQVESARTRPREPAGRGQACAWQILRNSSFL